MSDDDQRRAGVKRTAWRRAFGPRLERTFDLAADDEACLDLLRQADKRGARLPPAKRD